MKNRNIKLTVIGVVWLLMAGNVLAQTAAFTYQGKLTDAGNPANGNYDMQFKLFDTPAVGTGTQQGSTLTNPSVQVAAGIFTVQLDFEAGVFDGNARYLEISVRPMGSPDPYTILAPRQPITSSPYAIQTINTQQLGGLPASRYIATDVNGNVGLGVSNPAAKLAVGGSGAYNTLGAPRFDLFNTTANTGFLQHVTNNGLWQIATTTGETRMVINQSGNVGIGTTTPAYQFHVSGSAFHAIVGETSTLNGRGVTGLATGTSGVNYGVYGQTFSPNGYAGYFRGGRVFVENNVDIGGDLNVAGSFSLNIINAQTQYNLGGQRVLSANLPNYNFFAGMNAGAANTTGSFNTIAGISAGTANTTGTGNSFFGALAGSSNTSGHFNSFFGVCAGCANTTGSDNSFFGNEAGLSNVSGTDNAFFGREAGLNNTNSKNSFFGRSAGKANTGGFQNTFVGFEAGLLNETGNDNTFFGAYAGRANTTAVLNAFFGYRAGLNTTTGCCNSFFGNDAGLENQTGRSNAFFGGAAGGKNTTGSFNAFFGDLAGNDLLGTGTGNTTGSNNTFFGYQAGRSNTIGINNTSIGAAANVGANDLTNATAIGAKAFVTTSNSLVLGSINGVNGATASTNVGIGTSSPTARLTVSGAGAFNAPGAPRFDLFNATAGTGFLQHVTDTGLWQIATTGGATRMVIDPLGNLGIGTTSPDQKLTVNGDASKPGGGSWAVFSDERLKTIRGRFTSGLKAVLQLQPLRYEYKAGNALSLDAGGEHIGFSAQAVREIIPEAVKSKQGGYLMINNDPIMWSMLNAIKEQQALIEHQQHQIDTLTKRVGQMHQQAELRQGKKRHAYPKRLTTVVKRNRKM